ncbi:MAG: hypothetical protein A2Y24_06055 [Clostridiales bacterium GWE2_32_10]|nr:MAG: hypothetical protein A2Y24_06055 [Clostridiales bacterium GWE2_32_10]HBY20723.1 hypothetical protein [Clostridiales bacterium]
MKNGVFENILIGILAVTISIMCIFLYLFLKYKDNENKQKVLEKYATVISYMVLAIVGIPIIIVLVYFIGFK